MRYVRAASVAVVLVLSISVAMAAPIGARLVNYPGYNADWQKGVGLPDAKGNANAGLWLEKLDPAADRGYAGAAFTGVDGLPLTELGFSRRNDGTCGDALSFHLTTPDGRTFQFACGGGVATPILGAGGLPTDWTQVRFIVPEGLVIRGLHLVFRMPVGSDGAALVDDLDVSGTLIGKP